MLKEGKGGGGRRGEEEGGRGDGGNEGGIWKSFILRCVNWLYNIMVN